MVCSQNWNDEWSIENSFFFFFFFFTFLSPLHQLLNITDVDMCLRIYQYALP